ncbi:hypothetical protein ASPVEDRAFT_323137 [Aspergillus versicolor CBS 583.65]|uniref:Major facilitator superfamily (MFS) profile domain-containing protein n=1 Tax=Aspergillus versicolor CBS 583.65 TaxID=1036611 RepID=A0A1L9PY58_ASPVE|nr:uncharacterized protein ASPVEDRAFT_323137 [Aspergillus versicolor CBS 583.65]OJJ06395.1 hypothetical protein ASPVEDRAFT_323137 [Aspergillus versicolor CBS 583.65]
MVNEYWIARRGMAYGILCGASGVSGSVMPFALQTLLAKYGYRTTLRAVAVALTLLTGPLIPLLKGRLPPSGQAMGVFPEPPRCPIVGSSFSLVFACPRVLVPFACSIRNTSVLWLLGDFVDTYKSAYPIDIICIA